MGVPILAFYNAKLEAEHQREPLDFVESKVGNRPRFDPAERFRENPQSTATRDWLNPNSRRGSRMTCLSSSRALTAIETSMRTEMSTRRQSAGGRPSYIVGNDDPYCCIDSRVQIGARSCSCTRSLLESRSEPAA